MKNSALQILLSFSILFFGSISIFAVHKQLPPGGGISIVDKPDMSSINGNYVNNRAPLMQNAFIKLPVGSIKPQGWLKEILVRQKNGLCGNLGKISAWLQKDNNAWLSKNGKGEFGWEEVPYWLKGYGDLGYILNDKAMIDETKIWINAVLTNQQPNGDFGQVNLDASGAEDFWPKMIMLYCLQSYYEYSHDTRVIDFMQKYFRYQLNYPDDKFIKQHHYWQGLRTGDNLYSVLWLYNLTGEGWLLDLAKKIHENSTSWENRNTIRKDSSLPEWWKLLPDWHNVNITQGFREPATYYLYSKNENDLKASYDVFSIVRRYFGQVPGGLFGADENARPGHYDPRQGTETCGMVEQMNSDEQLFRQTADMLWADHAEDVAFNSYPAALMPDMRSLRYITSPNMVLNDDKDHSPGIQNSGPFLMMNPFSSRCCQHNHSQGWPYYAENLWMASNDNGLLAALYSSSIVKAKVSHSHEVQITEIGNYPFDDEISFRFSTSTPVIFPFYMRVPEWCEHAQVEVNGRKNANEITAGKFIRIERQWKNGDEVKLKLPMRVMIQRWPNQKNSATVNYGPLTFSLKINEDYVKSESDRTAIGDSKWQKDVDRNAWPSYEIHPASAWNYGLSTTDVSKFNVIKRPWPKNDYPFTIQDAPIVIIARGRQIPDWKIDKFGLCGELFQSPVKTNSPVKPITLVPMGAARLRISQFMVVE